MKKRLFSFILIFVFLCGCSSDNNESIDYDEAPTSNISADANVDANDKKAPVLNEIVNNDENINNDIDVIAKECKFYTTEMPVDMKNYFDNYYWHWPESRFFFTGITAMGLKAEELYIGNAISLDAGNDIYFITVLFKNEIIGLIKIWQNNNTGVYYAVFGGFDMMDIGALNNLDAEEAYMLVNREENLYIVSESKSEVVHIAGCPGRPAYEEFITRDEAEEDLINRSLMKNIIDSDKDNDIYTVNIFEHIYPVPISN